MNKKDLLIEIGTEELPPKSLQHLATAFADEIQAGLGKKDLSHGECICYATPRRMAVLLADLDVAQEDQSIQRRGPAVKAAFDNAGNPSRAAEGFAQSCGVEVFELETLENDKGAWLSCQARVEGKATKELLQEIIDISINKLPIHKRMRWGEENVEFVRPVHWSVILFGDEIVPCNILGITASNLTYGHRFHQPGPIELTSPSEYAEVLKTKGQVIANFDKRMELVRESTLAAAKNCGGVVAINEDLLNEVTALVEWPVPITGSFDTKFLELPVEVLRAIMEIHQKYFPVYEPYQDDWPVQEIDQLHPYFIAISNIDSSDPEEVRKGNERVITPRLSDAQFFWQRDCSRPLSEFAKGLKEIIFQKELGTLQDKNERVGKLVDFIAESMGINKEKVSQAASLAKCDLLTDMVGEFPELQGTMGRYYALKSGVDEEVAQAIDEQYMPRSAGAVLPRSKTGQILALADKLDTLASIFAIGKVPSGDKDPFGLRRAALGCLRVIIECELKEVDLEQCLIFSASTFDENLNASRVTADILSFMMERLKRYYLDKGIRPDIFESVATIQLTQVFDFHQRIHAVTAFTELPEAESLTAANKRISNILRQAGWGSQTSIDSSLLAEDTELVLAKALNNMKLSIEPLLKKNDYTKALAELAKLRDEVDVFFDTVMVMAEDEAVKNNRLALLNSIRQLFLSIADISQLRSN